MGGLRSLIIIGITFGIGVLPQYKVKNKEHSEISMCIFAPFHFVYAISFQGQRIVEFDIYVAAGKQVPQSEDGFSAVIQISTNNAEENYIELIHYDRITKYGVYDKCRDKGIDGDLCVCSNSTKSSSIPKWHLDTHEVFGYMATAMTLNHFLYFYETRTPYGIILEISCDGDSMQFEVVISILTRANIVSSHTYPLNVTASSGMHLFVDVFYQDDVTKSWKLEYDVKFRPL